MPETTNPTAPGSDTSEVKSTRWIQIAAGALVAAGAALGALQEQFPESGWIATAAMLVGGAVTLFTQLGLIKSRTVIKSTMIASGAKSAGSSTATATAPPK